MDATSTRDKRTRIGQAARTRAVILHALARLAVALLLGCVGCSNDDDAPHKAALSMLVIEPSSMTLYVGSTVTVDVQAVYTDGSKGIVSRLASWSSSLPEVASFAESTGVVSAVAPGETELSATYRGLRAATRITVKQPPATLISIEVTPDNPSLALGTSQNFNATGVYSDGTKQTITNQVIWSSSVTRVATISNASNRQGLATSQLTGTTVISAALGAITASVTLTVSNATLVSLQVSPQAPSIALGTSQKFAADGTYSDGTVQNLTTQVTWSSTLSGVATVSNATNAQGFATTVSAGTTSIVATLGDVTGTTQLTVGNATLEAIEVTPDAPTIALGTQRAFVATGIYSDGSKQDLTAQVTWASSAAAVATISSATEAPGVAVASKIGSTTISATFGDVKDSTRLTVSSAELTAIELSPNDGSIARGTALPFSATGVYSDASRQDLTTQAIWTSASASVATISNASGSEGLVTSKDVGTTTITARLGFVSGSTNLAVTQATLESLEVTPCAPTIALGTSRAFQATGIYSDGSRRDLTSAVTWAALDLVAAMSNPLTPGVATGTSVGVTTISATLNRITGATSLTVTDAKLSSIEVTPADATLALGTTREFRATGIFDDDSRQDLTEQVTWASSASDVAVVENTVGSQGTATAWSRGRTTVSASIGDLSGSATLEATAAKLESIEITPRCASLALDTSRQLEAIGIYEDHTKQDLTAQVVWSSFDESVASVSKVAGMRAVVVGVGVGQTTISAVLGTVSSTSLLDVTGATLTALELSPVLPALALGTTQTFTATGLFSDSTQQDLTDQVIWSSSSEAVAPISNAAGTEGLAVPINAGVTTILAARGDAYASTILTVTPASLVQLDVSPVDPSLPLGADVRFEAVGSFSDGTTQNVSERVTWSSTDRALGPISNGKGSEGQCSPLTVGSVDVTATLGALSDFSRLEVTDATLQTIDVTPAAANVALRTDQQFTALGTYSDGSQIDITHLVTWMCSDTAIAAISNAARAHGLSTGLSVGITTVSAILGNAAGDAELTVSDADLWTLILTPELENVSIGEDVQMHATGLFSDGHTQDLTQQAVWSSSSPSVATISNTAGRHGRASVLGTGTTIISVVRGGAAGASLLTGMDSSLLSISIGPSLVSLTTRQKQQLTATGVYSDGTVRELTDQVFWKSSNKHVASVSSLGLVRALGKGQATLSATRAGVTGIGSVSVL